MLTSDDIKKMEAIFATKEDITRSEEAVRVDIRKYASLVEKAVVGANEIHNEQLAHNLRHDDAEEKLRQYDSRLKRIESLPNS